VSGVALNDEYLPGNTCFGCGPSNEHGLRIRVLRDGDHTDRLVGTYRPREIHVGFTPIVHGGAQFAALDCMAAWCVFVLRGQTKMIPLTKTATMKYSRPATIAEELSLAARITREPATPRDVFLIESDLRNARGEVLSEASFEYVLLPPDRFRKAVGLDEMPDAYRRHFEVVGT
jgi:acyl-coenzyme A thioesterase PaaI-like protein